MLRSMIYDRASQGGKDQPDQEESVRAAGLTLRRLILLISDSDMQLWYDISDMQQQQYEGMRV